MKSTIFSTILIVAASPSYTTISHCTAYCGDQEPVIITESNAREVAIECFKESSFSDLKEVSHYFFLDEIAGACTDVIFTSVQSIIDQMQLTIQPIPCTATCLQSESRVSYEAAFECFSYTSVPILGDEGRDIEYELYSTAYNLEGKCSFQQMNVRETALRDVTFY